MKPSARIQTSIELLDRIQTINVPMDSAIGDYMRGRRYIGSKDRSNIVERMYRIMRHWSRLTWLHEKHQIPRSARMYVLICLMCLEDANMKRIDDLCDGSQYAPEPLSDEERVQLSAFEGGSVEDPAMPIEVQTECPAQHLEKLQVVFGEAFVPEMHAMQQTATLDLHVNSFVKSRKYVQASLAKDGIETDATPYSDYGLRCREKAYLTKSKAMNKGWIFIQDEGSQLISQLSDAQPGMQVLDYCAGGGGKTLALAVRMQRKGRIVAMDIDGRRLEKGRTRFKKAGLADIIEVRGLDDEKNKKWLRRQKGKFDRVLVDAPCSGSGTWRRNPDARWRNFSPPLEELLQTQVEILDRVAATVKDGGRLIYATCSLFKEENEQQIERFLADHPDFNLVPIDEEIGIGSPYMRLSPHQHKTDGFFTAILEKIKS